VRIDNNERIAGLPALEVRRLPLCANKSETFLDR
jgi:hypothetical protein